ncbi:MAG: hypothetical protein ACREP9_02135 [Candidatus Dormibacteraceae bacterium]
MILPLFLSAGCDTTNTTTTDHGRATPRLTQARIVFNTTDLLYTGGLGEAGVEGFCRRLQSNVAQGFAKHGITVSSNLDPSTPAAKLIVTLSTIETKSGGGLNLLTGVGFNVQKLRAKYSATLESPDGAFLASWQHEVDEEGVDKLTEHMAADIVKYLKSGFSR